MKRRLVTPQEILTLHYQGIHSLTVPQDAIITPGAADLILALSFKLTRSPEEPAETVRAESPPGDCAAEPEPPAVADLVRRLVQDVAPHLSETLREQVICAVIDEIGKRQERR